MGLCVSKREYDQILKEKEELQNKINSYEHLIINQNPKKDYNPINFYDIIIYIESINDITKGWKVELSKRMNEKYKEFAENKVVKIGVIGNSNKGKSFILSKISGIYLPFGTSLKTQGLSIKFPELKKYPTKTIALLDSAGLETPVLLIKDKIENKNEKNGNENINKNLEKKLNYKKKLNYLEKNQEIKL